MSMVTVTCDNNVQYMYLRSETQAERQADGWTSSGGADGRTPSGGADGRTRSGR